MQSYIFLSLLLPFLAKCNNTYTGEIFVTYDNYILNTNDQIYNLITNQSINAKTGDYIQVNGNINENTLYANNIQVISKQYNVPTKMNSIAFMISYCNKTIIQNNLTSLWLKLKKYYEQCSFGKTSFDLDNNIIIPEIVNIPCNGITYVPYNLNTSCNVNELYSIVYYIEQYTKNMNITIDPYTRIILLLPNSYNCPWAGLANLGCGSKCHIWTNGNIDETILFHELGHTMGLQHSNVNDPTCALGSFSKVCFNAPQSYSLGWNDILQDISNTNITTTLKTKIKIPGYLLKNKNFVKYNNYFISFRIPYKQDSNLLSMYKNKVFVHSRQNPFESSLLLYILDKNQSVQIDDLTLYVKNIIPNKKAIVIFSKNV